MRDFETCVPFAKYEVTLARNQGIGVIISEPLNIYFKLYYDRNTDTGINFIDGLWNHSKEAKLLLIKDLGIGYDIMFINNNDVKYLCEGVDERDKKETLILFKEYKKYPYYNHY